MSWLYAAAFGKNINFVDALIFTTINPSISAQTGPGLLVLIGIGTLVILFLLILALIVKLNCFPK